MPTTNSEGKINADCGDVRFIDANDNELDYTLETSTCNSANTLFWVWGNWTGNLEIAETDPPLINSNQNKTFFDLGSFKKCETKNVKLAYQVLKSGICISHFKVFSDKYFQVYFYLFL